MTAPRSHVARAQRPRALSATWKAAPEVPTPFRVTGLDGIRALAVTLVILFHLTPGTTVGGYLGVDLFFVVSGFLITSLLLRERDATGRIALGAFWTRRARRLLPALAVLVLVCCTAAWAIGGDVLVGLGLQVLGAATFSSNWLMLAAGSSYFGDTLPELFRNLWSLAVEEQFYLAWPLLLVLVPALFPKARRMPRPLRLVLVALLAAASAVAMAVLYTPADATRVYYGTDTHAFGLAIGALLALLTVAWPRRVLEWPRLARRVLAIAGPLALVAVLGFAVLLPGNAAFTFRGGLVIVAGLTAVVIASLLAPGTPLARLLDLGVFRWVGKRSYGLYLWHWPVFVLVISALPGWARVGMSGWALGGIALAISVVAAALSYRFVEQPIRRRGFRAVWRDIRQSVRGAAPRVPRVAAAVVVALLVLGLGSGTVAALVSGPAVGQTQAAIEAGQKAVREAIASASPAPTGGLGATGAPTSGPSPAAASAGDQITAIGDSVMLAAAPQLESALPGVSIDAVVSRSMGTAPGIIQADLDAGQLRRIVVLELATNGPISRSTLERVRTQIGPQRELVVVSAQAPRGWIDPNNVILSAFAQSYRNVELANWHDAAQPILGELAHDQVHFGPIGAGVFTGTIEDALQRLAELPPLRDQRSDLSLPEPF